MFQAKLLRNSNACIFAAVMYYYSYICIWNVTWHLRLNKEPYFNISAKAISA